MFQGLMTMQGRTKQIRGGVAMGVAMEGHGLISVIAKFTQLMTVW